MKHLKVEEEDGGSDKDSKVEEVDEEEMDGGDRSNVIGSTNEGFSLTVDGMSNSLAMSFQWLDKVNYIFLLICLIIIAFLWQVCGITPTSKRGLSMSVSSNNLRVGCSGQYIYMMAMLLIPLIPIFALVTQNVILLNDIIERKADLIESSSSVENGDETATLIGALQQERSAALMGLFLREGFDSITDKIDFNIDTLRISTDTALENITLWRAFTGEGLFRSKLR